MKDLGGVDYSPLKYFSSVFNSLVWLRRARMIIVRVMFFGLLVFVIWYVVNVVIVLNIASPEELANAPTETVYISIQCPGPHPVCAIGQFVILPLLIVVPLYVVLMISMAIPWWFFARNNHFAIIHDQAEAKKALNVPSFKGKLLSSSTLPIVGEIDGVKFCYFMRSYKEGGLLRWRERKMDSLMRLQLSSNLPHIIVNLRDNEKTRRSNMTSCMENAIEFQFEGTSGVYYDAYTANGNQVVALQVFTPDVLEVLYNKIPNADIEIYGSYVWVVERHTVVNDKTARQLFEGAFLLYEQIAFQLKTIK